MKAIADCYLYGILDLGYVSADRAIETARKMIEGGVDIIQLRAKQLEEYDIEALGTQLTPMTEAADIPLIINDHPELVPSIGANGVHVGQDDRSVADARWRAGRALAGEVPLPLVGKSTHSLVQAVAAAEEGADYIGFGPLFATPTKPDYTPIGIEDIRKVHELVQIPIFCIGGIKQENLAEVIAAGARRVVIVSGILQADNIVSYTRAAKEQLLALL